MATNDIRRPPLAAWHFIDRNLIIEPSHCDDVEKLMILKELKKRRRTFWDGK